MTVREPLLLVPANEYNGWINPNQKQINIKIASGKCPVTFALLKKVNNLSTQLADESEGFSFKKLFTAAAAGLFGTGIFIGASYLEPYREPSSYQMPVQPPLLSFTQPPLLLTEAQPETDSAEIPALRVDSSADKQLILAPSQQLAPFSPTPSMKSAPTPSFIPTLTSIGWIASGIFAWKYATKYSNWKELKDTAQEIEASLPMVESELASVKIEAADREAIASLFNAQISSFLTISPQRRNLHVTWMNALLATAAGCVYGTVAYGINNMSLTGLLGPIYFPSLDFLLTQVLPVPKGEEQTQVLLQKETRKYLS